MFTAGAMVCHHETGKVLAMHFAPPGEWRELLAEQLLAAMESEREIPRQLRVRNSRIAAAIDDLCETLGIELITTRELTVIEEARRHFAATIDKP